MVTVHHSHRRPWGCLALLAAAPVICSAQFGGKGYEPPAPICKPFKCPAGQKAVGNSAHKLWSYGCKDSGINVMSMGSLDPNNPMGGMKGGKSVDKCCVDRSICTQTCGTTSRQCHDEYWACTKKICKGDQNCDLAAMMGSFQADPADDEEVKKTDPPEEYNYEKDRQKKDCRGYEKSQESACQCVPKDDWQSKTESNLKVFYKAHNPEKLDASGEIKDLAEVWKKWKGKEPDMFKALATKYKKKAVELRVKPKPPPYKPPPPLSKEEQEKEDKRMAEQRAKWDAEDKKRDAERDERDRVKAEEKEAKAQAKKDEEDGETVEL